MRTTTSPLSGSPRTTARSDKAGKPIFSITTRSLTPGRARVADTLTTTMSALWGVRCVFAVLNCPTIGLTEICAGAVMYGLGHVVISAAITFALRTKTEITMTTSTLSVRHWGHGRPYDRNMIQGFALLHHDGAEVERFKQEFETRQAAAKGKVIQPTPYYMRSFHVVAVHAGQRVDLLTVYGQKEAAAIAARLTLCNQLLNEAMGMRTGPGVAQKPGREWHGLPGGVSHE